MERRRNSLKSIGDWKWGIPDVVQSRTRSGTVLIVVHVAGPHANFLVQLGGHSTLGHKTLCLLLLSVVVLGRGHVGRESSKDEQRREEQKQTAIGINNHHQRQFGKAKQNFDLSKNLEKQEKISKFKKKKKK